MDKEEKAGVGYDPNYYIWIIVILAISGGAIWMIYDAFFVEEPSPFSIIFTVSLGVIVIGGIIVAAVNLIFPKSPFAKKIESIILEIIESLKGI